MVFLFFFEDQSPDVLEVGTPGGVDLKTGGDSVDVRVVQDLDYDVLQTPDQ